ncbi:hypothetical protein HYFRA_00003878 [Hymenoscyphus fraxineus]|uniref:Uncharacterized protein n=1 Tax=Hymenoscyphus fraxineus TaxID=746836 RepID=A0A9N9L2Q8_9HELO|nr:hypothetical protein HYFRA_00003878 [Hymenoscyphus fraxineus]
MQLFSTLLTVIALAHVAVACSGKDQDCCWNNMDGCVNQHGHFGQTPCAKKSYREDFCENFKTDRGARVSCDGADCCRISTGKGRSCP